MKKKSKGPVILLAAALLLAGLITSYCVYAERYRDTFIEGTYINGIDAGGMNTDQVEDVIRSRVEDYSLTLKFKGGKTETLKPEDIGFAYNSDRGIAKLMDTQNPYEWIMGRFGLCSSYTVGEAYSYDPEKLESAVMALPEFSGDDVIAPQDAFMKMSDDRRLVIVPEVDGNTIRPEIVMPVLKEAVETGLDTVDITEVENSYMTAETRSDDPDLNLQVNDLNTYLDVVVTYDMYDGTQVNLDRNTIWTWLSVRDDDPNYYYFNTDVVQQKCAEFVKGIATAYDKTYDSVTFRSTNRGEIVIPTEQRGYVVDQGTEASELYQILLGRTSVSREPLYSLSRKPYGSFSTYVEVDIRYQHVYYYSGGDMIFDSSCVTGLQSDPSRRTPTGLFSIIEKDTARTLRGETNPATGEPSYESFVNYWMRFYEGCGLHDASWRSNFGGDIYLYSGSHGCVNMPYWAAQTLYGLVEYDTPVVVI